MATLILGFMLASAGCRAATFSWPAAPAWAATGPTNGNTEIVDYGYNAQGSLRVAVLNSGVTMTANYPSVAAAGAGNVTGGVNLRSLQLAADTTSAPTSYQQVTFTFMYTGGVSGVSFTLWDVDSGGGWTDQISNIQATTTGGATVYPTTLTGSASNSVTGSGATALATGTSSNPQTSAGGDVNIAFTQTVTSITFRWANTLASGRTQQFIGISPINFTPIGTAFPEVNSSSAALALCGGVMGVGLLRRRSRNAEKSLCRSHT